MTDMHYLIFKILDILHKYVYRGENTFVGILFIASSLTNQLSGEI